MEYYFNATAYNHILDNNVMSISLRKTNSGFNRFVMVFFVKELDWRAQSIWNDLAVTLVGWH